MKQKHIAIRNLMIYMCMFFFSCDPVVTDFEGGETEAVMYEAASKTNKEPTLTPKIVTWNIRFGSKRFAFFGDSCGDEVIVQKKDILSNLSEIAEAINILDPDVILLQEVDVSSKRSGYVDQVQYLLDNTIMNYGCFASIWKADFIPTYGLGKINMGNAILSKYALTDAERIKLSLRTDQSGIVKYFYLRRNILKTKVPDLGLYAVNIHATAFATDSTKQNHIDRYLEVLAEISDGGYSFVTGGDLNSLPPGASEYDFCNYDGCESEVFHVIVDGDSLHKEGSFFNNFDGEIEILQPLYDRYIPAIGDDAMNRPEHFTHAPSTSEKRWGIKHDRKLDYLFTNRPNNWEAEYGITHQDLWELSDHMPVSGRLILRGE